MSSPLSKKINVYSLFNNQSRRKRSHGKRHYNKKAPQQELSMTLVDIVDMIDQPEGVHHIKRKLFSMSIPEISHLQQLALESTNHDFSSAEYRATAIILDIAQHRLFRSVRSDVPVEKPKYFMKIEYLHKAIDAINLPGLLRSKLVTDKVPVYFKNREPPIISYQYTKGGFPLIAEITRCHTFTKEINHASVRSQYFEESFYCKNCLRVFSDMTGKPVLCRSRQQ